MTATPAGYFQTSYSGDLRFRKTALQRARLVLLVGTIVLLPWVLSGFYIRVVIAIALAIPGALALNLLTGVAGQISLGNAAFMGIGATTAAVLGTQYDVPVLLALPVVVVLSAAVGALVGLPSLRVRGLYLIIATLALHFIMAYGFRSVQSAAVGEAGFIMPSASVLGLEISSDFAWYFLLFGFVAIVTLGYVNIVRSRAGRAWMAIRERDIAAEILGVAVGREKIKAFALTSAVIGLQGALQAYYVGVVNYETFDLTLAISYIAMIIIGGLGTHRGAIYGAAFVTALPYLIPRAIDTLPAGVADYLGPRIFEIQAALFGALIIVFMLYEPKGIAEVMSRIRKYFLLWPFSRERLVEEEQ